jgi:hypothetical protein
MAMVETVQHYHRESNRITSVTVTCKVITMVNLIERHAIKTYEDRGVERRYRSTHS